MILVVVAGMAALGMLALVWMLATPTVDVPRHSWLEVDLAGDLPEEAPSADGWRGAVQSSRLSSQRLFHALRAAETDDRLDGVLLRPDFFGGSLSQATAIRAQILRLRDRGMPVWAMLELPDARSYYIATACDVVAIAPEGQLRIPGLRTEMLFLRDGLDQLGVEADYVSVGEFKSAPEFFERSQPTEPARRQAAEYLDDAFELWIDALAQGRGLTRQRMLQLVDRAEMDADEALGAGLVDRISTMRELREDAGDDIETVEVGQYAVEAMRLANHGGDAIAVIYAAGTIVPGHSGRGAMGERFLGSETLQERLLKAERDENVRAVVLRIDSPGGSATASDAIYRSLLRLRESKPVVASLASMAASGGYYVAMPADHIVSDALTLTGSIGVYMGKMDLSGSYEKLGIGFELLERGEHASIYSALRPFSENERNMIEGRLRRFYDRFVGRVSVSRGMTPEEVDAVAQGRVWSGQRAVGHGLADELGDLQLAIDRARELAGLAAELPVSIRHYQPEPSLLQRMLADLMAANGSESTPGGVRSLQALYMILRDAAVTLDGTPQFHLPWLLRTL